MGAQDFGLGVGVQPEEAWFRGHEPGFQVLGPCLVGEVARTDNSALAVACPPGQVLASQLHARATTWNGYIGPRGTSRLHARHCAYSSGGALEVQGPCDLGLPTL